MRSIRSVRATRFATLIAIAALALPVVVGPATAANPVIYTAGTTQDFDSSNQIGRASCRERVCVPV